MPTSSSHILRAVLKETVVRIAEDRLELELPWQGGDLGESTVAKNRRGMHHWATSTETERLIHAPACLLPGQAIASTLKRWGQRTGTGST